MIPNEVGYWFGRTKALGNWAWWMVRRDEDSSLWAYALDDSGIGYRLGFIEWDLAVGCYPLKVETP